MLDWSRIVEILAVIAGVAATGGAIIKALSSPSEVSKAWDLIVKQKNEQLDRRDNEIVQLKEENENLQSELDMLSS